MGDIAHADEDFLYHLFGIDAELLIDHAWGIEPTGIADIKAYKPDTNCLSSGQVLSCDYPFEEGKLIVKEMMDLLCLDMVEKKLVTPRSRSAACDSRAFPGKSVRSVPLQNQENVLP
mgnify:CR=1 FL=1